jgi:hypothetical protein
MPPIVTTVDTDMELAYLLPSNGNVGDAEGAPVGATVGAAVWAAVGVAVGDA